MSNNHTEGWIIEMAAKIKVTAKIGGRETIGSVRKKNCLELGKAKFKDKRTINSSDCPAGKAQIHNSTTECSPSGTVAIMVTGFLFAKKKRRSSKEN